MQSEKEYLSVNNPTLQHLYIIVLVDVLGFISPLKEVLALCCVSQSAWCYLIIGGLGVVVVFFNGT